MKKVLNFKVREGTETMNNIDLHHRREFADFVDRVADDVLGSGLVTEDRVSELATKLQATLKHRFWMEAQRREDREREDLAKLEAVAGESENIFRRDMLWVRMVQGFVTTWVAQWKHGHIKITFSREAEQPYFLEVTDKRRPYGDNVTGWPVESLDDGIDKGAQFLGRMLEFEDQPAPVALI